MRRLTDCSYNFSASVSWIVLHLKSHWKIERVRCKPGPGGESMHFMLFSSFSREGEVALSDNMSLNTATLHWSKRRNEPLSLKSRSECRSFLVNKQHSDLSFLMVYKFHMGMKHFRGWKHFIRGEWLMESSCQRSNTVFFFGHFQSNLLKLWFPSFLGGIQTPLSLQIL